MKLATEEKRQAILGEVQATLQMLADTDLKIYGEISRGTLEAVQIQGFAIENGSVKRQAPKSPLSAASLILPENSAHIPRSDPRAAKSADIFHLHGKSKSIEWSDFY